MNRAICVLGMHRSGTSAITRILNLMGVDLGRQEALLPSAEDNPEGFWEHSKIVDIQERLLGELGRTWDTTTPLLPEWWTLDVVKPFKTELMELLRCEFAHSNLWGWKDPRTCVLLPLWKEIASEMGFELSFVHVVRNPLEVAESLHKRNGFTLEKGWALWTLYVLYALEDSIDSTLVLIAYEDLLRDWEGVVARISQSLKLRLPSNQEKFTSEVRSFLKPGLRHNIRTINEAYLKLPRPIFDLFQFTLQEFHVGVPENRNVISSLAKAYRLGALIGFCESEPSLFPRMQVYYSESAQFEEVKSKLQFLHKSSDSVTYRFPIPDGISFIRIDPIDTPALMELQDIVIENRGERKSLLSNGADDLIFSTVGIEQMAGKGSLNLLVYNGDPQIHIRLPEPTLSPAIIYVKMSTSEIISQNLAEFIRLSLSRAQKTTREARQELHQTTEHGRVQMENFENQLKEKNQEVVNLNSEMIELQTKLNRMKQEKLFLSENVINLQDNLKEFVQTNTNLAINNKELEVTIKMKDDQIIELDETVRSQSDNVMQLEYKNIELDEIVKTQKHLIIQLNQIVLSQSDNVMHLEQEMNMLLSSRSWRWTSPVRKLFKNVRRD